MKDFTIKELEKFSGVKAHTIRIWELRYGLLKPKRNAGNTRVYSLPEVKKMLDIALLNSQGYRISRLCKIDDLTIETEIQKLKANESKWQKAIYGLTVTMYSPEPGSFEKLLDELSQTWHSTILIEKIVYPFLTVTSLLWVGNKLYEEHFVVTCMRQKLLVAIEKVPAPPPHPISVLLFLPDNKQLDLGLLYSNYFLKKRGYQVIYLGTDVTMTNLQNALQLHDVNYIFTYLKPTMQFPVNQLLAMMQSSSPGSTFVIANYAPGDFKTMMGEDLLRMPFSEALTAIR